MGRREKHRGRQNNATGESEGEEESRRDYERDERGISTHPSGSSLCLPASSISNKRTEE